jgi:hypothetical protein
MSVLEGKADFPVAGPDFRFDPELTSSEQATAGIFSHNRWFATSDSAGGVV